MNYVSFKVKGEPIAKGSAIPFLKNWPYRSRERQLNVADKILNGIWKPLCDVRPAAKGLKAWEKQIKQAADFAMRNHPGAFDTPVMVMATFYLQRPQSHFKGSKRLKDFLKTAFRKVWPQKAPDLDKLFRAINDGMNGVVFVDDKQVIGLCGLKKWGVVPGVRITVIEQPEQQNKACEPEQLFLDFTLKYDSEEV